MGKKGFAKKGKFDDLDKDYKETVENMSNEEIRARVAVISLENEQIQGKKALDMDLKDKASSYQEAGRVYRDSAKGAKLRIQYALSILEARGKA
jgi:hypothetical protein